MDGLLLALFIQNHIHDVDGVRHSDLSVVVCISVWHFLYNTALEDIFRPAGIDVGLPFASRNSKDAFLSTIFSLKSTVSKGGRCFHLGNNAF